MEDSLVEKIAAIRRATEIGCFGAHQVASGQWLPCSSTKQFLNLTNAFDIKSRMSLDEMRNWSSIRKAKGRKRKKRWEKLRERRVLGIDTLPDGSLVSGNSRTSANAIGGGSIPSMTYGNVTPPNMSTKSIQPAYMPRDNDPDVFIDIESARKRAQQLGCIGVSRRMSKGGKVVWMPCTNLTDYNNLTGMTSLGRANLQKRNDKIVRTIVKENLKKKKTTIQEEIYGKALGPRLRGIARMVTERFDPNAEDGDGDGMLQDGTAFQRPALPTRNIVPPANQTPRATNNTPINDVSISAVAKWRNGIKPSDMEDFRGEPIEAYEGVPGSSRGMASRGPGFIIDENGPRQMGGKRTSKPIKINDLRNPEASSTNPFRNLGGKKMGQLIRGMVKRKNRGKSDRTTYIVGGNTGSGKSTVLEEHLIPEGIVPSQEEAALIDPDFIKKGLVGYDDGDGAGRVHGESQVAADKTIRDAAQDGMDMIITGSGAKRQITHIRDAKGRGETVVGHWVHIPQPKASQRIKERMQQMGRFIPDNTEHMAQSIPKAVNSAFDEDLLDEFYLWDNDVPKGSKPKLIAKKIRGQKFEVYDKEKFEEFAGGADRAESWIRTANRRESPRSSGLASSSTSYTGEEAASFMKEMGFEAYGLGKKNSGANFGVYLPEGSKVEEFFKKYVQPLLEDKFGRTSHHNSRLGKPGAVVVEDTLRLLGIDVDKRKITEKAYRKKFKLLLLSDDEEVIAKLFENAPIQGPKGESRFGDLRLGSVDVEIGETSKEKLERTTKELAQKTGLTEEQITKLMSKGWSAQEIDELKPEDIKELLDEIKKEEDADAGKNQE